MFIWAKRVGRHVHLRLVENRWVEGRTRQRVVATLGRLDRPQAKGQVDALLASLGRFADKVQVQEAYQEGSLAALGENMLGPSLVFGQLLEELGMGRVLKELLSGRKYGFDVDPAVFGSVLYRLFEAGSHRQAHRFLRDVKVAVT